jgi:hypothetical protein
MLVHPWPSPVVARVTSGATGVDPADVERELTVARHAARAGAPVVQPSDVLPPGPHRRDGHTLVFWRYVAQAGTLDVAAAGRGLHAIHDSLADYEGELPRAGRAEEVRTILQPFGPSDDVELLCELASRELPDGQALRSGRDSPPPGRRARPRTPAAVLARLRPLSPGGRRAGSAYPRDSSEIRPARPSRPRSVPRR